MLSNQLVVHLSIEEKDWYSFFDEAGWVNFFQPRVLKSLEILESLEKVGLPSSAEISFLLTNDEVSHTLNKVYREKDSPTNVLSFSLVHKREEGWIPLLPILLLGDIVLSFQTIQREALEQKKKFLDHVTHLVIHGTLHLLGYDHEHDDDAYVMEALEINILEALSVGNPYSL